MNREIPVPDRVLDVPLLGVSIAIPPPWGQQLQDYRIALGDDAARAIPTHITLLPPYDATADQAAELADHCAAVAAATAPFKVQLRGTGTFRPVSPVVFIVVVAGISGCEQLAARMHSGPSSVETKFPYHPHVTVAHLDDDEALDRAFDELAGFEATFDVTEFSLYDYVEADGWVVTHTFPLSGE